MNLVATAIATGTIEAWLYRDIAWLVRGRDDDRFARVSEKEEYLRIPVNFNFPIQESFHPRDIWKLCECLRIFLQRKMLQIPQRPKEERPELAR